MADPDSIQRPPASGMRRLPAVLALVLAPLALGACVERTLVIRSDPPGARLRIDGEEHGTTPAEVPFSWYGTREFVLELDGYRPLRVLRAVDAPWYQVPVLDFLSDVVLPAKIHDERILDFALEPLGEGEDRGEVLRRAEDLRRRAETNP